MAFDNRTIAERTRGKPHIVLRNGWWRVSKMQAPWSLGKNAYNKAHNFVYQLNHELKVAACKDGP